MLVASAAVFVPEALAASGALAIALAWASMIDIDRHILPDVITLGLIVCGLALACFGPAPDLFARAAGAVAGYGAPAFLAFVYKRIRGRDGLGLGDAKLLSAAGAWLGWSPLPFVLVIAASAGLLFVLLRSVIAWRPLEERIAFGPFIAAGFWSCWLATRSGALPLMPA